MNHSHTISAAIQLVPVDAGSTRPYQWIDEVIDIIKESGLAYEVGPFSTSIDADYKSVMELIDKINQYLLSRSCPEWLLNVQLQVRSGSAIHSEEKIAKFRS